MKKKEFGVCVICNEYGELTYEHIPPKSAGNSKPKLVKSHEHLFDETSYFFGKSKKINKGFGKNCLCENCNNFLGSNYVNDYVDFVNQCLEQINKSPSFENFKVYEFHIKPLNVFKQIFSMFVCLNQDVFSEDEKKVIKDFILRREIKAFIENYNIYVFNTFSKFDKWCGLQVVSNNGKLFRCSEIAFKPFGFQMTFDSEPTNQIFQIINCFINFDIDQKVQIQIPIPRYDIKNVFIGQ